MRFDEFIEQIMYGECYNLALGMSLREGEAREQAAAKRQVAVHVRQGLMELSERFDVFVNTESVRIPIGYAQARITNSDFLRVLQVTSEGVELRPYSVENTENWDYKTLGHGVYSFHSRWEGEVVQFLYKSAPVQVVEDSTVLPAPFLGALGAYVAHRAHSGMGGRSTEEMSITYARYRDAVELLEDSGYGTLQELPAHNVASKGFI